MISKYCFKKKKKGFKHTTEQTKQAAEVRKQGKRQWWKGHLDPNLPYLNFSLSLNSDK